MSVTLALHGVDELQRDLSRLPTTLARETQTEAADPIAQQAAADIRAAYPRRTGALAAGVRVERGAADSPVQAAARVVNTHPLASVFEHGTQARHTALGAFRGSMPAGNIFIPRIVRHRRVFWTRVTPILERQGLTVTGRA